MERKKGFTLLIILLITTVTFSQAVPPPIPPPPPPGLPIDGGFIWLFLAGIIFGIKKIKG